MEHQLYLSAEKFGYHFVIQKSIRFAQLVNKYMMKLRRMMLETEVMKVSKKIIQPQDRCDSCIAKAAYVVAFSAGSLYFCGHHFRNNEEYFINNSLNIFDENDETIVESGFLDTQ